MADTIRDVDIRPIIKLQAPLSDVGKMGYCRQ
jgi:hypothetical protein